MQLADSSQNFYSGIFSDLDIDDKQIESALVGDYNSQKVRALSQKLASEATSYDADVAAGRLLLFDLSRICGKLKIYMKLMKHRLSSSFVTFVQNNFEALEKLLRDNEKFNYNRYTYFAAMSLFNNYLMKPTYGEKPFETPLQLYLRIAIQHWHTHGFERVKQCFEELVGGYYIAASPTMFNSGTKINQLASCFLLRIDDNLKSILYKGVGNAGEISGMNGGLGFGMNDIRCSSIRDDGKSKGIIPFGRLYDSDISCVDQGGKREGAGTAFLRIWHLNVIDFIKARDPLGDHHTRFHKLNTCIWMSDLFMERVDKKGVWTMFCPKKAASLNGLYGYEFEKEYIKLETLAEERDIIFKEMKKKCKEAEIKLIENPTDESVQSEYDDALDAKIEARRNRIDHKTEDAATIRDLIINNQMRASMPYIMNGDTINAKSNQKNIGPIDSSNLCLEIVQATPKGLIASCNLSSMNLSAYVLGYILPASSSANESKENQNVDLQRRLRECFDFLKLGKMTGSVVRNVEQLIDENRYPLDEYSENGELISRGPISTLNFMTRPEGIGVSGYSTAIQGINLIYDEYETEMWNVMTFGCIYFSAVVESVKLSIERGPYPEFKTGEYQEYVGLDGGGEPQYVTRKGSPMSNGVFQFDLWAEEARKLNDLGKLDTTVYDMKDDIPIDPLSWGQTQVTIPLPSGEDLVIEPTWESLREAVMKYGVRHSLLIALMPTASSAQVFDNAESTELPQSNLYTRKTKAGSFTIKNYHMIKDLTAIGCWNDNMLQFISISKGSIKGIIEHILKFPEAFPEAMMFVSQDVGVKAVIKPLVHERLSFLIRKYKTAFEVSQKIVINHAAQRGRYVCQSQSMNIYMVPTIPKLRALHSYSMKKRVKTNMYYLRQPPASEVGDFNVDINIKQSYTLSEGSPGEQSVSGGEMCTREMMESGCSSCSS
jgi:ribonucleotide reductase alpha subunit